MIRTSQVLWTHDEDRFLSGTAAHLPDGLYAGSLAGPSGTWKGKRFDREAHRGVNIFATPSGLDAEKYPFTVSVGPGTHDSISVIRIDYNVAANPFWLRPVLDEIVEVAPGQYLGKLELRVLPGYPFTLLFFNLSATTNGVRA
ncbi:MAG: uncharacterized protein JWO84_507 [Parcubacteria group bacterium]|nr:uncharacterized protein [Parcubacteria group bacterium]